MVCLGFEPWTTGLLTQMNPLSYGGPPTWFELQL